MVGTPRESRAPRAAPVRPASASAPSSRGSEARNNSQPRPSAASSSTAAAAPRYFSVRMRARLSVQRDLQDLHRVGAALHSRELTLGENDEVTLLHQLQLDRKSVV